MQRDHQIQILYPQELIVSTSHDHEWILSCQVPNIGGIARSPEISPDIYHTYLSLAALSIGGHEPGLGNLCAELTAPQRAVDHLHRIFK